MSKSVIISSFRKLLFSMLLLLLGCQPGNHTTIDNIDNKDNFDTELFQGKLSYTDSEYIFSQYEGGEGEIIPFTIPQTQDENLIFNYEINLIDVDELLHVHSIEPNGIIRVDLSYPGRNEYLVKVSAEGIQAQEILLTISVLGRPSSPTNIQTVLFADGNDVEITWHKPLFDGSGLRTGTDILEYHLYYLVKTDSNLNTLQIKNMAKALNQVKTSYNLELTLENLEFSEDYYFVIEVYNTTRDIYSDISDFIIHEFNTNRGEIKGTFEYFSDSGFIFSQISDPQTIEPLYNLIAEDSVLEYSIHHKSDKEFTSNVVSIVSETGQITISPNRNEQNLGLAVYTVHAEAENYIRKEFDITINILQPSIETYYDREVLLGTVVTLGQGLQDESLNNNEIVLKIKNVLQPHLFQFNSDDSSQFTLFNIDENKQIYITKKNLLSFEDGSILYLVKSSLSSQLIPIAEFKSNEIYTWHDLQSMRLDKSKDYKIKKDIRFPEERTFITVGSETDPFRGSIDGVDHSIIGMRIVSNDTHQGLFGSMKGARPEDVIAQDLTFVGATVEGRAYVGTLAGSIRQGTVNYIAVLQDENQGGKVLVKGHTIITESPSTYGYGGGIVGRIGREIRDLGDTEQRLFVLIKNSYSEIVVEGETDKSTFIGGIVGKMISNTEVIAVYSTNTVTSLSDYVGGLTGESYGKLIGYSTGDVTGKNYVGGLVGNTHNAIEIIGYSRGTIKGEKNVGGLVGDRAQSTIIGYTRSSLRRISGSELSFGRTIGEGSMGSDSKTYHSKAESKIYVSEDSMFLLDGRGLHGNEFEFEYGSVDDVYYKDHLFSELTFGNNIGDWIYTGVYNWPALNMREFSPPSSQPIDR